MIPLWVFSGATSMGPKWLRMVGWWEIEAPGSPAHVVPTPGSQSAAVPMVARLPVLQLWPSWETSLWDWGTPESYGEVWLSGLQAEWPLPTPALAPGLLAGFLPPSTSPRGGDRRACNLVPFARLEQHLPPSPGTPGFHPKPYKKPKINPGPHANPTGEEQNAGLPQPGCQPWLWFCPQTKKNQTPPWSSNS